MINTEAHMHHIHVYPDSNMGKQFILPFAAEMAERGNGTLFGPPCDAAQTQSGSLPNIDAQTKLVRSPIRYLAAVLHLVRYAREKKEAVVFIHTTVDSCGFGLALRIFTRSIIVYVNHGVPYLGHKGLKRHILRFIERLNLWSCNLAVAINNDMASALAELTKRKPIVALVPGTLVGVEIPQSEWEDIDRQKVSARKLLNKIIKSDNALVLLYVGRLVSRKGLNLVLSSARSSKIDIKVIVCGAGLPTEPLVDDRVFYLGHLPSEQLHFWYLAADVLCVPSSHEGMGQVYLEAATRGTPSISANIPGPRTFVDEITNGYLVDPENEQQLTALLEQLFQNRQVVKNRGKNAFFSVRIYDRKVILKKNAAAVREAIRSLAV